MAGAEIRSRLQKLGVWRESGHEHLRGSLVVPIFDETGSVVQMYGRIGTPWALTTGVQAPPEHSAPVAQRHCETPLMPNWRHAP